LRWKGFSPRREPGTRKSKKDEQLDRFVEVWDAMSPEEQAAAWDETRKVADAKMAEWGKEAE
jgi:hypothetical protein